MFRNVQNVMNHRLKRHRNMRFPGKRCRKRRWNTYVMLNKSTMRFDLQLPTFSGWNLAFPPFSNIPGDPFGDVMARYDTLWHVMVHGSRDVYARYGTLWHVMARYGTLWFRSGHNVQETQVKRTAFLTKMTNAGIYTKKHQLIVLFLRERYAILAWNALRDVYDTLWHVMARYGTLWS